MSSDDLRGAVAAFRAGKLDEAEALCGRISDDHIDYVASLQLLAAIAGRRRETRRGIELMERAIALRPDSADAYIELAKLQRLDGLVAEPIAALGRAIALKPDFAAAQTDLGLIHMQENTFAEAMNCFQRAVELAPDLTVAHFNLGVALESSCRNDEAIAAYRRAIELSPDFAEAHLRLGDLMTFEGDRASAIEHFRVAADLRPDTPLALIGEAKILIEERQEAAALTFMRRATERFPKNSQLRALLGAILMRLGKFDDAATELDLSLALNRRQSAAYHALVHVKKLAERDRPLMAQMEWAISQQKLADDERADLHFALGKGYDDLREFESAIGHFDRGNALKRRRLRFDRALYGALVDGAIAKFDCAFFARNAALASESEMPVLILGMPRSGTTLVEQIVSNHPDVEAGGELAFWGEGATTFRANAADQVDPDWVQSTARDYIAELRRIAPNAQRVTDKAPSNFLFLGLIHVVFPRAQVIHCRRHPVDTCLSIYFQSFASRMDYAYDREDLVACYGHYRRLMAHWRATLPPRCLLEVDYEELVADREAAVRAIVHHCGLRWDDACLHSERNPGAVRTASVWQARQPVYNNSVERWRHYEPWLGAFRQLFEISC